MACLLCRHLQPSRTDHRRTNAAQLIIAPYGPGRGRTLQLPEPARWDDARRLSHDATLTTGDRVAGLLLLFYAQRLSTISTLTVDQVSEANGRVSIRLGTARPSCPNRSPRWSST